MRLPNFGYHLARLKGRTLRRIYEALLPIISRRPVKSPRSLALDAYAYSSEQMVPEQIRSIRSFLRHVGRPKSFTIISDGSHTTRSIRLLQNVDPLVSVCQSGKGLPAHLPPKFHH